MPSRAWTTARSSTLDEQLFDHEADTPTRSKSRQHPAKRAWSVPPLGDVEGLADRPPDDLHVLAIGQGLIHGAAAQDRQYVVLGDAFGVRVAELRAHPPPEGSELHGAQATGADGRPDRPGPEATLIQSCACSGPALLSKPDVMSASAHQETALTGTVGTSQLILVCRRHVDLLLVSSAVCRPCC